MEKQANARNLVPRPATMGSIAVLVTVVLVTLALVTLVLAACTPRTDSMTDSELIDLATRYAAGWSGQNPDALASFYAENGSLTVNEGTASVGRAAIAAKAGGFMAAFPDMVVKMDSVSRDDGKVIFSWTWTGTNTGPGGTGSSVRISGYEEWTFSDAGLILVSNGHYDEAEYERQMGADLGDS